AHLELHYPAGHIRGDGHHIGAHTSIARPGRVHVVLPDPGTGEDRRGNHGQGDADADGRTHAFLLTVPAQRSPPPGHRHTGHNRTGLRARSSSPTRRAATPGATLRSAAAPKARKPPSGLATHRPATTHASPLVSPL